LISFPVHPLLSFSFPCEAIIFFVARLLTNHNLHFVHTKKVKQNAKTVAPLINIFMTLLWFIASVHGDRSYGRTARAWS
jgi:hypothetical protein